MSHTPTAISSQRAWLDSILGRTQKLAIDQSGLGHMLAEQIQRADPGKVVPGQFTAETKEAVFDALQARVANGTIRFPADDGELRRDVLSLRREVTPTGRLRLVAPRSSAGHSDRATAIALACYVARKAAMSGPRLKSWGRRRTAGWRRAW